MGTLDFMGKGVSKKVKKVIMQYVTDPLRKENVA